MGGERERVNGLGWRSLHAWSNALVGMGPLAKTINHRVHLAHCLDSVCRVHVCTCVYMCVHVVCCGGVVGAVQLSGMGASSQNDWFVYVVGRKPSYVAGCP